MPNELSERRRVLVVEDDPDFSALLATMLRKEGLDVTCARTAEEAKRSLSRVRPDLITLDIHMPGQSGALFYRRLRSREECRSLPVIVVTGLTRDDRDMRSTLESFLEVDHVLAPTAYVEKHLVPERLCAAVAKALGEAVGAPVASAAERPAEARRGIPKC